jgi:hypothetical protein
MSMPRPGVVLTSCLLAIGFVYAAVFYDRELADSNPPLQAMTDASIDIGTNSTPFLTRAKVLDQGVKSAADKLVRRSNFVGIQNRDMPVQTMERVVNIGEDLNADSPGQTDDNAGKIVSIGPDMDADDPGAGVSSAPVKYVNIGLDMDADASEAKVSDVPVKYANIGPDIDVGDMYRSADYKSEYPQNIGPDIDVNDVYQD